MTLRDLHTESERGSTRGHGARKKNVLSLDGQRALGLQPFIVDEQGITPSQRAMRLEADRRLGFA